MQRHGIELVTDKPPLLAKNSGNNSPARHSDDSRAGQMAYLGFFPDETFVVEPSGYRVV